MSFVKLHESITDSTIWDADPVIRLVWIALLLKCDRNGNFQGTTESLARWANVSIPDMERAMGFLAAPDPRSTTPDDDGRRIMSMGQNLWAITNYPKYRALSDPDEERQRACERKRAQRARARAGVTGVTNVTGVTKSHDIAEAEADAEADAEAEEEGEVATPKKKADPVPVAWFFKEWNELAKQIPTVPTCRVVTDRRAAALRARIGEHGVPGVAEILTRVAASPFLRNEVPAPADHPNFRVDVDWVLNPANAAKILEGRYNSTKAPRQAPSSREKWAKLNQSSPALGGEMGGDSAGGDHG